jgi:two-component sensor histidine kinase
MSDQKNTGRVELLEQQRVLAEFGDFALKAEDLDAILHQACQLVGRALKTDLAKIVEFLPEDETLKVRAGVGWKPGIVGAVKVSASENSPEGLTLKEGAVISKDREKEKRFPYHSFLKDHGVKAFVNVLILSSDHRPPFGVLQVDSRHPREFTQPDIEFLRTYANLVGAAIERLRVLDELRAAVREKDRLLRELNHRVKNTLATVQSIASVTLRNATSVHHASDAIESRLIALANVHNVLTSQSWAAVDLRDIVRQAIEPYDLAAESCVSVQGPSVPIPPRIALALAMALQELATNAVKYGALSNRLGQIKVRWELDGSATSGRLLLTWEETNGPPVEQPTRRGFGTRLIERSLAKELDGQLRIDFAPTGVVCTINVPLR